MRGRDVDVRAGPRAGRRRCGSRARGRGTRTAGRWRRTPRPRRATAAASRSASPSARAPRRRRRGPPARPPRSAARARPAPGAGAGRGGRGWGGSGARCPAGRRSRGSRPGRCGRRARSSSALVPTVIPWVKASIAAGSAPARASTASIAREHAPRLSPGRGRDLRGVEPVAVEQGRVGEGPADVDPEQHAATICAGHATAARPPGLAAVGGGGTRPLRPALRLPPAPRGACARGSSRGPAAARAGTGCPCGCSRDTRGAVRRGGRQAGSCSRCSAARST